MDDLLSEFLTETNESLSVLDVELVKLEQNPNDPDLLSNIFRLMHTIKGTCGFLGLPRLETVAHAGENVLGKVRDGKLVVTPQAVSLILQCLDQIREILMALEASEVEPEGDDEDLIARLNALAEDEGAVDGSPDAEAAPQEAEGKVAATGEETAIKDEEPGTTSKAAEPPTSDSTSPDVAGLDIETDRDAPAEGPEAAAQAVAPQPRREQTPPKPAAAPSEEAAPKESAVAQQSIRVNVDLLENLMTMVSELVLTRNQCLQILRAQRESVFQAPLQRLNLVVSELQEGVMKTRMQPIGNAWAKLPRIVRDLSHELDKKIELVMKGADTELDRQVLELIKDPLTHMVRNSADHGVEKPAERAAAGKPETGTILLNALHEGGHIIIEIADDGRGLALDKIKQKAIKSGLASESDLEAMSEKQLLAYVFKPGISTSEVVTAVSGRGVGMDVVRTNIEKIGGTIELSSVAGQGTKCLIKIPLTLAIVSALIIESAGERFAIPQLSVVELVRASLNSDHTIERINDTPVLRLRNRLLPLVNLRELLGLEAPDTDDGGAANKQYVDGFIVVTQVGAYSFGLIVDRVFDTEEIVVKPVAPILRHITLFSGNTILGDGSVVMILDPNGIAAATGEITVAEDQLDAETTQRAGHAGEKMPMLVFRAEGNTPKAVPLSLVARLEEIDLSTVERSNGQHVVQYRGQLMPLVQMDEAADLAGEGRQPVLVFADVGRSMGLVVEEIIDIVEDRMDVELTSDRKGYLGSAIVAGQATDIIDAGYYLSKAFRDWFIADRPSPSDRSEGRRVLLVDDSPFFRNLLAPLLSVAGYEVTAVEGANQALELCESGQDYDVIISDIEMPEMDGFAFAQAIKGGSRWSATPILALSSHASPQHLARSRSAGFDDYVAKSDRDALLQAVQDTLSQAQGAA